MRMLRCACAAVLIAACGDSPTTGRGGSGSGSGAGTEMMAGAGGAPTGTGGGTSTSGTGGTGLVMGGGAIGGGGTPVGMGDAGAMLGPGGCGPVDTTSLCSDPTMGGSPPPPPAYSGGACPQIKVFSAAGGSAADTINTIQTATGARTFYVVAPDNPCPGEKFPVVFLWHWIGGKAQDWLNFVSQPVVNQFRFIAVAADGVTGAFKWPFTVLDGPIMEAEFKLFDDMYACVAEQFDVNPSCITSLGVSAGGLFNSQVLQARGKYLSSAIVISGGTGAVVLPWVGSEHKMPVIAFWGGPADNLAGFSFDVLMKDMEAGLQRDGHYFIECVHNCGHAPPLLMPPAGGKSPLDPLFNFLLNHPYGLPPGASPYKTTGKLPDGFPYWCNDKGMGSAPPDTDPVSTCPAAVCTSPDTPIATPEGERPIAELRTGDLVYSLDHGAVVPVPLVRVSRTPVVNHHVVRVQLANGRVLEVSGPHPLAEGGTFADLAPGSGIDGEEVVSVETIPYEHPYTHDILPASDTGTYFAAGVRIASTLFGGAGR